MAVRSTRPDRPRLPLAELGVKGLVPGVAALLPAESVVPKPGGAGAAASIHRSSPPVVGRERCPGGLPAHSEHAKPSLAGPNRERCTPVTGTLVLVVVVVILAGGVLMLERGKGLPLVPPPSSLARVPATTTDAIGGKHQQRDDEGREHRHDHRGIRHYGQPHAADYSQRLRTGPALPVGETTYPSRVERRSGRLALRRHEVP